MNHDTKLTIIDAATAIVLPTLTELPQQDNTEFLATRDLQAKILAVPEAYRYKHKLVNEAWHLKGCLKNIDISCTCEDIFTNKNA